MDVSLKFKIILRQMLMSQAVKEGVSDSNASESVLAVLKCPLSCLFNSLLYGFFTGQLLLLVFASRFGFQALLGLESPIVGL